MNKVEYLISSFNNIQDLIKFTDQKVAAVLVICGIEITVFVNNTKDLYISFLSFGLTNVLAFIFGFIFSCLLLVILFLGIFKVLKPRFACTYEKEDYSCYYFGHIASKTKENLNNRISSLDEKDQINELKDQLFEVSIILNTKNQNCAIIMKLLFFDIVSLVIFVLLTNLL